jgi:hypothetical protein
MASSLTRFWDFEILADLPREYVVDLGGLGTDERLFLVGLLHHE